MRKLRDYLPGIVMDIHLLQQRMRTHHLTFVKLLMLLSLMFSILVFTNYITAHEANPVDTINPSRSEPALGSQPQDTILNDLDDHFLNKTTDQCLSQPSWWSWLLSASGKPANFHYIDIMELLDSFTGAN